ncbi:MAG TPA: class I SAM-dependent methyltransferase [Vicinamibacterales bacterium]|jgi:SAM-dependent methyltransferase
MDYLGHQGRPDLSTDAAARAFFARIDGAFHRAAWFAHAPGAPLFSGLIDYAALRGRRVLEVGCGLGAISAELARQGANLVALDLTWAGVTSVTRRFALDRSPASAVQGDAMRLPFADASFDFVWSWGVLLHAPDLGTALAEIRRVLKPGGEVALMIYNRHSVYNWLGIIGRYGVLRMQLLSKSVPDLWSRYSDGRDIGGCPFVRYYSAGELRELLAGFDVVEMRAFEQKTVLTSLLPGAARRAVEPRIPDVVMRGLFKRLGMLLYCRARRR